MTAARLLTLLAPCRPTVDGRELVLQAAPAPALLPAVRALQTGLRAVFTGRPWYAYGADGRAVGPLRDGALDQGALLPWCAVKLCVAGDGTWDVVRASWRHDLPHLFGPPPDRPHRPHVRSARRSPWIPLSVGRGTVLAGSPAG